MQELERQSYRQRIAMLTAEIDMLTAQVREVDRKLTRLRSEREGLERQAAVLGDGIIVTDHAIVRWYERIRGVDMDRLRVRLCPESVQALIKQEWSGVFPVETWRLRVEKGIVKTILPGG